MQEELLVAEEEHYAKGYIPENFSRWFQAALVRSIRERTPRFVLVRTNTLAVGLRLRRRSYMQNRSMKAF